MVSSDEIRRRLEAKRRGETLSEVKKTPSSPSKACPKCQTPNPESAKFCVGCGAPLAGEVTPTTTSGDSQVTPSEETPLVTPTPETPPADNYKLCPSCNQKNKLDAKFCIICGHKFEENEAGQKPLEPLVDVVEEKETPTTETTETEPAPESVVPEIKVPEQFKSENKPVEELSSEEVVEVESKETAPAETIPEVQPAAVKTEEIHETKKSTQPDEDPVLKIKKAKELLDIGAITQEEFDQIKNKYLELI